MDIPSMPYDQARSLQLALVERRRRDAICPDVVLLLEHPPVLTVGRRGDLSGLKVGEEFLRKRGILIRIVERGGLITYHGPGQLVGYPIVDLRTNGWKVVEFVEALEEVMIRTVVGFGIQAHRSPLNRGVWVGTEKLGSVGIAVRGGVAFHGFALNVNTGLEPFGWIDLCGLKGIKATSMATLAGGEVSMIEVRHSMREVMEEVFGVELRQSSVEEIEGLAGGRELLLPPGVGGW